ncbi:MAG TPA: outer membrane lipoprotein LolB [Gammaproteobacteria bacterium]|nr:outer membrane lipoprotein LolB [Gammaproteobacteria bacterium]
MFQTFCIAGVVMLSGCATTPPISSDGSVTKPPQSVEAPAAPAPILLAGKRHSRFHGLDNWRINGRLGIRQGDDGFSAGMLWQQKGTEFDIALLDPLGRRVAQLLGNADHVALKTVDGNRFEADNAEELLEAKLGWSFPVQSLFYWIKGTPNPKLLAWREEYDDRGRLVKLHQGKWKLNITKYQNLGEEYIPKLIKMEREDIKVKLLIRDWE